MKTKKIPVLVLVVACFLTLFTGCVTDSDNTKTTAPTQTTLTPAENKLEDLEVIQPETACWKATDANGLVTSVTANYCETNGIVNEMQISVEIPVSSAEHDAHIAEYEKSKAELDNLNDYNIELEFVEKGNSTTVLMQFSSLEKADRANRISCIEGILDIEASDADYAFYYSELDKGLTLRSFENF